MASTKQILTRIKSVKSTKKITEVMKMIAASSLKSSQKRSASVGDSSESLYYDLSSIISGYKGDLPSRIVGSHNSNNNKIVILFTSDKGLCGGFNNKIIRSFSDKNKSWNEEGFNTSFVSVGFKGNKFISRSSSDVIASFSSSEFSYNDSIKLVDQILADHDFNSCSICYTKFVSSVVQEAVILDLFPLCFESTEFVEYNCDGNIVEIITNMFRLNLAMQIYSAACHSLASEHMSRMIAMENASKNANEVIDRLTLLYNRTRQALITRDLIEIISGAEAM